MLSGECDAKHEMNSADGNQREISFASVRGLKNSTEEKSESDSVKVDEIAVSLRGGNFAAEFGTLIRRNIQRRRICVVS